MRPLLAGFLWYVVSPLVHAGSTGAAGERIRVSIGTILPKQDVYEGIIKYAIKNFDSKTLEVNMVTKRLDSADYLQIVTAVCQLMKEGVLAFIIPPDSPPVVRDMLTSYSSHFHIPIVSTQSFSGPSPGVSSRSSFSASISNAARAVADGSSGSGSSATSNLGISTFVPLAEAVAALLRRYKWQQVAYIHDDSAAPDILEAIQNSGVKVSIAKKVKSEAEASDAVLELSSLGRLRPDNIEKIVLNVNKPSLIKTVLTGMIREVKSFKNLNTQFILASLVTDDFWQSIRFRDAGSSLNVTAFRLVDSELPHVMRFHKKMMQNPNYRDSFKNQGTESYLFLDAVTALLTNYDRALQDKPTLLEAYLPQEDGSKGTVGFNCMDQSRFFEHGKDLASLLKQIKLPEGQTGTVEFLADGSRLQPTIAVIHSSHVGHVKLGSWSPKKGLMLTDKPEALPQIKAPGAITPNKEISVGGILSPPYLMLKRGSDADFTGLIPELLEALANVMPFSYKIHAVPRGQAGARTDNNASWTGLISEVINKKVEIAIADIPLTADRQQHVEYTQPFLMDDLSVVVSRKSQAGRPSLSICFITIFSWQLWLCILGVFFTFVLLAYLLNRLVSPQEEADSFGRTLWLSAGSFLCRSPGPEGRCRASRLLLLFWWFFLAMVTVLYVSAFVAIVQTVVFGYGPDVFTMRKFVQDAASGTVDIGYVRDVVPGKVLKTPRSGEFATIYSRMLSSPRGRAVPSVEDGVHAVSANFAFLGLHSQIEPYLDDCSKRSYVVSANFAPYSIMMPKMSPYRDMFNQAIERLREAGVLADLRAKWLDGRVARCLDDKPNPTPSPLKLSPVFGVFAFVILGFVVAMLLGAVEFSLKPRQETGHSNKAETSAAQKALWDKNADQGLRPYTPNDPALGNDEELTLNQGQLVNGTPRQVRVMVWG
ncbi:glutamate receptor 3-like isoform X2 [Varroa destructor]|uniref:Glutamate receptor n=1 Tax=Varroa destructor TaxID=109461 RepID=A0A7M7KAT3_VARDE|nr:glutamate receptor 3-like isoform X2 [Varroa destructor]